MDDQAGFAHAVESADGLGAVGRVGFRLVNINDAPVVADEWGDAMEDVAHGRSAPAARRKAKSDNDKA